MSDLASRITDPREEAKEEAKEDAQGQPTDQPEDGVAEPTPPAVTEAEVDGDGGALGDGPGLHEPEWDVEVSLSELQNNEATPFHSATTWQDLGLYATPSCLLDV